MKKPKCKDTPTCFWYPQGSIFQELSVFRWVKQSDCVKERDFLSNYEEDKLLGKDIIRNANIDKYYGISTYEDISDAKSLLEKVPAKKRILKAISVGSTKEDDGVIRKTPSNKTGASHLTWWLFDEAKPEEYFELFKEDNDE